MHENLILIKWTKVSVIIIGKYLCYEHIITDKDILILENEGN